MRRLCSSAQYSKEFEHAAPGSGNDAALVESQRRATCNVQVFSFFDYIYIYIYVCVCIYVCIYVCVYIYIYLFDDDLNFDQSKFVCSYTFVHTFEHSLQTRVPLLL